MFRWQELDQNSLSSYQSLRWEGHPQLSTQDLISYRTKNFSTVTALGQYKTCWIVDKTHLASKIMLYKNQGGLPNSRPAQVTQIQERQYMSILLSQLDQQHTDYNKLLDPPSIAPTSFFILNSNSRSLRNYTRRCLGSRHPLCGSWVTSWMYMIGDWSLTLSPRKPSLKLKITFFFFLKKEAPFTFMTTDLKPIFLADRPTCSATASEAYRDRRDRPFLSSK